ncbi:hypothetical protein B0H10DRAFT_1850863 [Mycena sp. CBHHK59/15]|nr:hypothetical protein B0H10DRAFT_1850863 [Mycena sp. CBHHK59/15]
MAPAVEKTCKPRAAPTEPYKRGIHPPKPSKEAPKTSAMAVQNTKRQNLMLNDWMNVFAFIDTHLGLSQQNVTHHFKILATGPLIFFQQTLSRNLQKRGELEACISSNPSALSSKHECVVTRPDVKRGLVPWVSQIERKGETVTGDMLIEKCSWLEKEFGVPEEERLTGHGWLVLFLKTWV